MSYNLTTMQYIGIPGTQTYYISPTAQAGFINFAPNYTARNTTKLEFTFVPGTFNGSCWVGHMGVTPDISNPDEVREGNIYRLISYDTGDYINTRLDVQGQMENLSTLLDSSTPKLKVEMWDYGINIWDENGTLIETHTWTPEGTWDSGISIYGWPVKEEYHSGVIEVLEDFKLYSVKITDDTLGLIYDGVVNANGLYDSVSQTYTTITGWNIGADDTGVEIVEITHNNSIVYQKGGPTPPYDIRYTTTNNQKLTLPSESDVASHTFNNNEGYITLNANTAVPYQFFNGCTTLQRVYYSNGVTFDIQGYQHEGCSSLEYVELPSDLTALPTYCFKECNDLCEITLPSTIASLGDFAFYQCGRDNHNNGYYQPDVKFTSSTVPTASGINAFLTESAVSVTAYNTIYKLVPYEAWPEYASNANWRTSNNYIDWYDDDTTDYALIPFYIENTTDNAETITIRNRDNVPSVGDKSGVMYISDDGNTWEELVALPVTFNSTFTFTLSAHTRKYLKATCTSFSSYQNGNAIYGMDTIGGNINTLINGYASKVDVAGDIQSAFTTGGRDDGNSELINAKNLCVDYATGARGRLLVGCRYLKYAPKIIGGSNAAIAKVCQSCIRLTHAPKVLDSTLIEDQFYFAFDNCTALKAVQIGNVTYAPTNDPDDFNSTFKTNNSLCYMKCMFDPSTLHNNFSEFSKNVAANGVFVKKVGATWPTGTNGIPSGWTVLEATE